MQAQPANQGHSFEYAVIGRLNKDHGAYALNPQQIKHHIANALIIDVDPNHIIHIPPNFIIGLPDGHAQAHILSAHPLLHTNYFLMEFLPWSKEHERCQLPWISDYVSKNSNIPIDPLTILPILPSTKKQRGTLKLKDGFSALIPKNYDLKSPDYSYLAITELKDFYYMKVSAFRKYKSLLTSLQNTNHTLYPILHSQISTICTHIHSLQCAPAIESMPHVHAFTNDIKQADIVMEKTMTHIDWSVTNMCKKTGEPIDLQGFRDEPFSSEVPVPTRYADRLKAIYKFTLERIQNTTPIIETIENADHSFQTYITVNNFTRTYYGEREKTAEAMEAAAVFYCLKQICNIQGYRIIDLNYPILAEMVSSIDRWNVQMNILDFLIDFMIQQAKSIDKAIMKAYGATNFEEAGPKEAAYIKAEATKLLDILNQHWTSINTIFYEARNYNEQYNSTKLGGYSPSRSYYRLGRAQRPVMQASHHE